MSADGNLNLPVPASTLGEAAPHGFFAPVSRPLIEDLIKTCEEDKKRIESISRMAGQFFGTLLPHFLRGNLERDSRPTETTVNVMFGKDGATKYLYAQYWQRALALTDVYDHMPQARRDAWNEAIEKMQTPEFTADSVIPTLRDLLVMREKFLAERVDGIFRNLSGEHVTNSPHAFGKRMIIGYMLSYGSVRHERSGYIHDLRCVIAKFMGRDQPGYQANHALISELQKCTGQWHTVDGGALRIRLYKKGTAHLEVHPDMAWRLNAVLANLYPRAIPAEFREKPKRKAKTFSVINRPLPFAVLEFLSNDTRYCEGNTYRFGLDERFAAPSPAREEAMRVIEALGGVQTGSGEFAFDYDYRPVFKQLLITGLMPCAQSHQYYPTPATIAAEVLSLAQAGDHDRVLEPSAGQGHLATLLPADRTTCVELSPLHCRILRAKGLKVAERDFLEWSPEQAKKGATFERIVMNPPFADGRAKLHLEAAQALLAPGGRLVAVLPASFRGKPAPAGWHYEWSRPIDNEFADTTVSVVLLCAERGVAR